MAKKRKQSEISSKSRKTVEPEILKATRISDEPVVKKVKWTNKNRVLIFSSRGISFRDRHLMKDFRQMMPHSKAETKMDRKDKLLIVNEISEMKNCQKCIFFEAKKKKDLYMWVANTPRGPSAKFLVENVHTMMELKMTGNCLKGSRPLLSFDKEFDMFAHWALLKELFIQVFSTPQYHPKSQPFIDHVFNFSIADDKIWFRNYQIVEENAELAEIGPRLVLNPIRIFQGSFGGPTLYQNPSYVSPNEKRAMMKRAKGNKYINKIHVKKAQEEKRLEKRYNGDPTDDVFKTH
ncbi:hypothetical protein LSH36_25g06044 [Paralvinella palmiformis]|uniref:Ribosome biogenesis protein BRX1 homolog n=1 Tax=Paralvinella palmiformis TaxID=53620 RepID=A0AAD9NGF9_9ANNE|nr:hypothetical protein LSH36_25g06044 [Paralvinella palmiformis]